MTQPQNSEAITPTAVITTTSWCCHVFKVWVSLPCPSARPRRLTLAPCLTTVVSFPTTVGGYGVRSARSLSREDEGATQESVKPCVSPRQQAPSPVPQLLVAWSPGLSCRVESYEAENMGAGAPPHCPPAPPCQPPRAASAWASHTGLTDFSAHLHLPAPPHSDASRKARGHPRLPLRGVTRSGGH